jgi:subfamily B ATP-binding cassette protein MsbA
MNSDLKEFFKRFIPYFKDYKQKFVYAVVGMIMAAAGTSLTAYMIKPVLDKIFIEKNEQMLYIVPFGLVLVYALKGFGKFIQVYYTSYIGQDIVKRLREKMLSKMLEFEIDFFHKQRSGELISRTTNDIERVRNVVANMIPSLLRESLTIIALLGYIIYLNPKMALISLVFIPLTFYPLTKLAKKMKAISFRSQEKQSDLTSRLSEIFNNIEMIQAHRSHKEELKKFSKENQHIFELNMKAVRTNELTGPLMETVGALAAAIIILTGGKEVIDEAMSVGSFFSFLTALFMLYTPLKSVSKLFNQIQDAVAASSRIYEILDRDSGIKNGKKTFDKKIEEVLVKDVYLNYGEKEALKGINFKAKKGEKVAFVGNSGGGKSSIINLLLRFYDPTKGAIYFNNQDIKEFDLDSLRAKIAIVTQRVYILNDTIANNIAYAKEFDEKRVIDALKKANAWEFVKSMENGIHTHINEFGSNLSGGQRQRLAIARAIYKKPDIFIFDEATSALDNESERAIIDAIDNISKDKITFVIAHRLNTIEHANKIILLKEGRIVCKGNKTKLFKECEEFIALNHRKK